jgi:hypothetical protein
VDYSGRLAEKCFHIVDTWWQRDYTLGFECVFTFVEHLNVYVNVCCRTVDVVLRRPVNCI